MKGIFITFEGPEGSGKSTQSKLLRSYLKRNGYDVVCLREPGGTKISEKIREVLLDCKNDSISAICELLLYMASRAQLVNKVIKPALSKGKFVICDRFLDSTIAYQGFGLCIDIDLIEHIGKFVTEAITPDITFFLDANVKRGLNRSCKAKGFADRIERRSYSFYKRVRDGYLALTKRFPGRIMTISVERYNIDEAQKIIRRAVSDVIKRHNRPKPCYRHP